MDVLDEGILLKGVNSLDEASQRDAFVYMAKNEIQEIDRRNAQVVGRDVPYLTYVNGIETENLFLAKTSSTIVAEWQLSYEIVLWLWELLRAVGPVKKGTYRQSVRVYADGVEIRDPVNSVGAREIMFLPTVPYARKIERGRKGYAPGAVYEVAAAMAKAKFSNYTLIKFTYAEPPGPAPALDEWAEDNAAKRATGRKQRTLVARNRRQPAIVIYL
jgi:hypothetical protein